MPSFSLNYKFLFYYSFEETLCNLSTTFVRTYYIFTRFSCKIVELDAEWLFASTMFNEYRFTKKPSKFRRRVLPCHYMFSLRFCEYDFLSCFDFAL